MEFTQSIINLLINCIMIICTKYYVDVNYGVEESEGVTIAFSLISPLALV